MDDLAYVFNQLDPEAKQEVLEVLEYPNAEENILEKTQESV